MTIDPKERMTGHLCQRQKQGRSSSQIFGGAKNKNH